MINIYASKFLLLKVITMSLKSRAHTQIQQLPTIYFLSIFSVNSVYVLSVPTINKRKLKYTRGILDYDIALYNDPYEF